jgi:hypothetical protein
MLGMFFKKSCRCKMLLSESMLSGKRIYCSQ